MKKKTVFYCTNCGNEHSKWMGQCSYCGEWNSITDKVITQRERGAVKSLIESAAEVVTLDKVEISQDSERIVTGIGELDAALGGGLVDDQVILISGEPGIGKSTLLLQMLVNIKTSGREVLYVSGEESSSQIKRRAERLFSDSSKYKELKFVGAPVVQDFLDIVVNDKPEVVVIDSIQTIYDDSVAGLPGSISQVRAATAALVSAAKSQGFILVLVGHINKDGGIAGPKVLEHLVDTVVQFEGDRDADYRILRVLKNRFGSTGEVGLVVMTESGLVDMGQEHNVFDVSEVGVGTARTLVMEGNRPLVVQVQALVNHTVFAYPKRVSEGIPVARLHLIIAILEKFAGANLSDKDVYIRTAGGYKLDSSISDLAIAAAIMSSLTSTPMQQGSLFVGELSLSGQISLPGRAGSGVRSVQKFGVTTIVTSAKSPPSLDKSSKVVKLSGVSGLKQYFK